MKSMTAIQSQLLISKLYVPTAPRMLIQRPRLHALLDNALKHPFTLVSAPAGFGKTTLLSTWVQSLPASQAQVAWLSLDEDDNNPHLFWTYLISALHRQDPNHFEVLLSQLQSPAPPPLSHLINQLINLLSELTQHFVLILDDYHLITEEEVHTTLTSLVKCLPAQLNLILATRADPPLPLPLLRAHDQTWEIRTEQLRCTVEETGAFFQHVMGIQLPDQILQEVAARTEGWLVGLQMLSLSLPEHPDPLFLLQYVSGEQRYILDYLTEVVLQKQPREVQTFLLSTSILEQLSASLCDAVMEQKKSQLMLDYLERANLFIISLDRKRQWYRYHALFAETLSHLLRQRHADLVPLLHHRASRWYAEHYQTTAAILHAFKAQEWQWAADLIEGVYPQLASFKWGANQHALLQFQQWVGQLPAEILACRPHFCIACAHLLGLTAPQPLLHHWLDLAEATLRTLLEEQRSAEPSQGKVSSLVLQEQRSLLGMLLAHRTFLQSYTAHADAAFGLYEQALAYLSAEDTTFRVLAINGKGHAYYTSSANDARAAIECEYQCVLLAQEAGLFTLALARVVVTVLFLLGAGRLCEGEQLIQQAYLLDTQCGSPHLPEMGWMAFCRAEILRERGELASARSLVLEALSLCEQSVLLGSASFLYLGYMVQIRICLSCGDLDAACACHQQAEQISQLVNRSFCLHLYSFFVLVDQVRLWLACGEPDRAVRWVERLEAMQQSLTPFARERLEVARARIFLAKDQPAAALQRLEPARQRASTGQRWGHVLETLILQALAHQKLHEEAQALADLREAVRLGEPEGYIQSFVEEGVAMGNLLSKLREQQRQTGPTAYLDTLLAAFPELCQVVQPPPKSARERPQVASLFHSLSERELQVLQLLAQGRTNQQIAHELAIALDTVKRHISHIFAKLGVDNRMQAIKQARDFSLLDKEF
jgi:LuxR family maltose regulon positive regulatory protein